MCFAKDIHQLPITSIFAQSRDYPRKLHLRQQQFLQEVGMAAILRSKMIRSQLEWVGL
jgi:hypothetical protein